MRKASLREVLGITALVSSCCLVYEMAIAASFISLTGDGVLWQSLTIALYLAALGAGTYAASRLRSAEPWALLFRIELALAFVGALAVPGILGLEGAYRFWFHFLRDLQAPPSVARYAAAVLLAHGWTLLIGFLSGFELPLLIRLCGDGQEEGGRFNLVLAANYAGALAGTLTFALLLFPWLGAAGSGTAAAALNLCVCLYLRWRGLVAPAGTRSAGLALAAALIALSAAVSRPVQRLQVLNVYASALGLTAESRDETLRRGRRPPAREAFARLRALDGAVERIRSRWQTIDLLSLTEEPFPLMARFNGRLKEAGYPSRLSLYLDKRYQFHGASEALYHEFMAHVPVQLFKRVPRDVLVLGGGDGLLIRELLKYGEVRRIVNVELDLKMIELARSHPGLRALNEGSYGDPRVEVLIDDAFSFVRGSRERFDAVYIDLPYPVNYDLTRLYSVEFYVNVGRLLRENGTATLDFPLVPRDDKKPRSAYAKNSVLFSTLKAAGFKTVLPFSTECSELIPWKEAEGYGVTPEDYDPKVAKLLRRVEAERFLREHPGYKPPKGDDFYVASNDALGVETMVTFSRERLGPDYRFKDRGLKLFSLTPERLFLLQFQRFPHETAPGLANSIFRPRLFEPEHLEDFAFM
ncbi:MAG TPA: hypothetical protein DCM05_10275 [Elusimicrobia bacterium]|nr:hypothetical protein [Elusimicrobiota bacterium]